MTHAGRPAMTAAGTGRPAADATGGDPIEQRAPLDDGSFADGPSS